ncbi:hypothetical protein DID96_02620 [Burkholderia sp. Bp8963]|uniref:hypothetical protein n=1 Tax=Burkholderia sp. Bp8963 TaxID=2184547 RepID=UPI000F595452|nr:hypothetical protein [Burkholderia sp. Bp8963]RQS76181.1 hypothetical protein DID96_02620 [Burkholderia sp. Bp8963]
MNDTDQQAIEDAVKQIGLSMAANAVPLFYVAQNVYDTSQSVLDVWNARNSTDEMTKVESGIDLVFAVVGWVPVVGAGVKRTFRLVNHNSEVYGPLLFDILRLVLQRAHCPTSPEQLVDKLFDASGLKKLLTEAREHIEKSWMYRELPAQGQVAVSEALAYGQNNLPFWLTMFVERKLMHWRRKQPNSSAEGSVALKKETEKPGKIGEEAAQGKNRSNTGASGGTINAKLAIEDISNKLTGFVGEHIADYHCYEVLKWGNDWSKHDDGLSGKWEMPPSLESLGKLNDGTKLNKLFAVKAHGRGLDGVWRANPSNNHGEKYALVEAKASRVMNEPVDGQNPDVSGKLGKAKLKVEKIIETVVPPGVELLEPPEVGSNPGRTSKKTSRKQGSDSKAPTDKRTKSDKTDRPATTSTTSPTTAEGRVQPTSDKIAQMSVEWIRQALPKAVGAAWSETIEVSGYARHILYTPFYSASARQHAEALLAKKEHDHHDHSVQHHYREDEVFKAVNEKQKRLNERYGTKKA